jgi:hypothetical protein
MSRVPIEPNSLPSSPALAVDGDHASAAKRLGAGLRRRQRLGSRALELGATRLELGHVGRRRRHRLALGNQVIAPVAGLYADLVAQAAQVADVLEQNYFHVMSSSPGDPPPLLSLDHRVADRRCRPVGSLPSPLIRVLPALLVVLPRSPGLRNYGPHRQRRCRPARRRLIRAAASIALQRRRKFTSASAATARSRPAWRRRTPATHVDCRAEPEAALAAKPSPARAAARSRRSSAAAASPRPSCASSKPRLTSSQGHNGQQPTTSGGGKRRARNSAPNPPGLYSCRLPVARQGQAQKAQTRRSPYPSCPPAAAASAAAAQRPAATACAPAASARKKLLEHPRQLVEQRFAEQASSPAPVAHRHGGGASAASARLTDTRKTIASTAVPSSSARPLLSPVTRASSSAGSAAHSSSRNPRRKPLRRVTRATTAAPIQANSRLPSRRWPRAGRGSARHGEAGQSAHAALTVARPDRTERPRGQAISGARRCTAAAPGSARA